jgi:uncharacterized protein
MPINFRLSPHSRDRSTAGQTPRSILALLLIVPVTSIGALLSTVMAPGVMGQGVALICGLWLLLFPLLWHRLVDKQPLPTKIFERKGWGTGIVLGILMFGVIFCSYWLAGRYVLDMADIRSRATQMGMNIPLMVFGFGTFQTLVNSMIEEYVWRWFVYRHCQSLWPQRWAIVMSAAFFTIHHIILMVAYCDNWGLVLVGAIGVFIAGVLWAVCMRSYQSLWPSYLSHLAADLALQIVSWHLLMS